VVARQSTIRCLEGIFVNLQCRSDVVLKRSWEAPTVIQNQEATVTNVKRLLLVCILGLVFAPSVNGQESIRLRFNITRNGSVVANTEISVNEGSVGRIEIAGMMNLAFTPRVQNSRMTVTFDIKTDAKHLQPQLAVDIAEPATISWTSAAGEPIKIAVVTVR